MIHIYVAKIFIYIYIRIALLGYFESPTWPGESISCNSAAMKIIEMKSRKGPSSCLDFAGAMVGLVGPTSTRPRAQNWV